MSWFVKCWTTPYYQTTAIQWLIVVLTLMMVFGLIYFIVGRFTKHV